VAGAEGVVRQSRGQQVAAGAYPNPSITGAAGRGSIRDPNTGVSITERTVTVEQPLEWPALRVARQQAADAGLASAMAGLDEARLALVADVKVAFFQLLLAQRDRDLAGQNLTTVEAVTEAVKARVKSGEGARFEIIKSTVEVQKARKEVSRTQNALQVARTRLDTLTDKGLSKDARIRGEFQSVRPRQSLSELVARAIEQNPALRRQHHLVEQADHLIVKEQASKIPGLTMQGTYHREAGDEAITAGISVPIPLWYRRQGEIESALGAKRQTEAEWLRLRNEIEQTVTQHFQDAQTASEQLAVFEEGLLKQTEEALEIAKFSFRQGAASLLEVLDAQRVYRQTLWEYAQARADLSISLAKLERWTGGAS
jgi:outer membrane protein, heavy metal efflux system